MRLLIAAIGRLKDGPERELVERYRKRADQTGKRIGFRDVENPFRLLPAHDATPFGLWTKTYHRGAEQHPPARLIATAETGTCGDFGARNPKPETNPKFE